MNVGARLGRHPAAAAYALAIVFAASIAFDLVRMPVQVSDSVEEILEAQASPSVVASFRTALDDGSHLRPLRIAQSKLLFDLSDGDYRLAYRGFHAMLIVVCLLLFTRALRVSAAGDVAAAAFALTVLIGMHTFAGTIREAFPVNHFLEVMICCLLTLNLAQSRGGVIVDVAVTVVFAFAALTLESGLLVWVVAVAAWLAGFRGISKAGVVGVSAALLAYVYLRVGYLDVSAPRFETSSGFGFAVLDPAALQARFGDRPLLFSLYNVVASMLSVLISEPQSGVFVGTRAWMDGSVPPRVWLAVASSGITTALIGVAAIRASRDRDAARNDAGLLLVGSAVVVASAVMSFGYTKDEIMSTAGAFYAIAAFVALRQVFAHVSRLRTATAALLAVMLLCAGCAWGVRSMAIHHVLRTQAFKHRNDWAFLPMRWKQEGRWPADPAAQRLLLELRADAIGHAAPNPRFEADWAYAVWGE